jgi:hypothetical protein
MFARRHVLVLVERRLTPIVLIAGKTIGRYSTGSSRCFHIMAEAASVSVYDIFLLSFGLNQVDTFQKLFNKLLIFVFVSYFVVI